MLGLALPEKNLIRIFTWLPVLIISICPVESSGKDYEAGIKSGVSRDILNYEDDSENLVVRGGIDLKFSESFKFDFTTLRNMDDKKSSWTWNLTVKNISGFMDFTSGNYNLHFGSGLMMGKPSYSSPDPFSKKISISKDKTISPSNGGNPAYSLYGAAFDFFKSFEYFRIYFIPFFSIQRRFISYESVENGVIDSSLFTLNSKFRKSGTGTEPVNIINYGGASGFRILNLFNIQLYHFETDLKGEKGKDILWDKNKYYAGEGIDLIRNSGIFAEYTDNNISLFIEPAMSSMKSDKNITGYAMAWGIGVRNSFMNFTLKGKNTDTNFHSEYSSGSRSPERVWETKCTVYPFRFLETGAALYTEKNLTPGYNKDFIEGAIQEEIFAGIDISDIDINLVIKRKEHYSTDRADTINQGILSAAFSPSERLYFKIKSSAQKSSDSISYLGGGELKFLFFGYFSVSLGYTRIVIDGEIPFYAVITPATEHSSITGFRESAHGGSVNFRYMKEKDSFYIRYTIIKTGSGKKGEAESALILFF